MMEQAMMERGKDALPLGARVLGWAGRAGAELEKKWFLYIFIFADVYLLTTLILSQRHMWYDELFTFYMTQLPSMGAVWSALKDGVDLNPPLFYLATRTFQALFGNSELVTRLPAILGFLIMSLCIFHFVSRYGSRPAALAAMTFPLVSGAHYYASEARPYGMVLAFAGLAAVSWQAAARDERRRIALPLLAISLAGALLSHCYATLVVAAFGLGEAARSIARRRLDWPMLAALALPCLAALCYLPMFAATRAVDLPLFRPEWASIGASYDMILGPALWPVLAALAIVAVLARPWQDVSPHPGKAPAGIPVYEMALAAGFALAPIFGVLLAKGLTLSFWPRYSIDAIIGASIFLGALVAAGTRTSGAAAAAVVLVFAGAFAMDSARFLIGLRAAALASPSVSHGAFGLSDLSPGIPIVIGYPLLFLEYDHYESKDVTDRIYFLTDRATALRYTGLTGYDIFYRIRKWFPIRSHLEDYSQFLSNHRRFFILSKYGDPLDWTMQKMVDDGLAPTFKGQVPSDHGDLILAEVSLPAK